MRGTAILTLALLASVAVAQDRPWPPSYKLRPHEKTRLTQADRVGPDGLVYPDWRYAGLIGGVADVSVRAKIGEFGGVADDSLDDAPALRKAIAAVVAKGGGAILLGPGTYHLDDPVVITDHSVVIRGSGKDQTKLIFRYRPPARPTFVTHADGAKIEPHDVIELRGDPVVIAKIRFFVGEKQIEGVQQPAAMDKTFRRVFTGEQLMRSVGVGKHRIDAVYHDDEVRRVDATLDVEVEKVGTSAPGTLRFCRHLASLGALSFCGDGTTGKRWLLTAVGRRGSRHLVVGSGPELHCTDRIAVTAPATERWNRRVGNACEWGEYRVYYYRVEQVGGRRITVNQPLRFQFPVADGSFVRRIHPVRRCGVEDLTIVQTTSAWTCGVYFCDAWECWLRRVRIEGAGRMPFLLEWGKWCEVRDCEFEGAGDVGWQRATDCLMTGVVAQHGPVVRWAASGNVIRDSRFDGGDMGWHGGWCSENLFENCVVSGQLPPPRNVEHGPTGPRNVVYNCDVRSPRAALSLVGRNEGWIFAHNRFVAETGPGVFVRNASFDHVFKSNLFVLRDTTRPLLFVKTPDCVGIELIDNRLFGGNGKLLGGKEVPVAQDGNSTRALATDVGRPKTAAPSIFSWQRRRQ